MKKIFYGLGFGVLLSASFLVPKTEANNDYVCRTTTVSCSDNCGLWGAWDKTAHSRSCVYTSGYRLTTYGNTRVGCPSVEGEKQYARQKAREQCDEKNQGCANGEDWGLWGSNECKKYQECLKNGDVNVDLVNTLRNVGGFNYGNIIEKVEVAQDCDVSALRIWDTTPPTCATGIFDIRHQELNGRWTCPSITLGVKSCTDDLSGCDESSYTTMTIETNGYSVLGQGIQACDNAGNCATCAEPEGTLSKIDCNPPILTDPVRLEHIGLGLPQEEIGTYREGANVFRADAGVLDLILNIDDADATNTSGKSEITWNAPTYLKIERIDQNTKSQQFGLENATPIEGKTHEYKINLNQYQFQNETSPIFTQAGLYKLTFQVYDNAGNSIQPKEFFVLINPAATNQGKTLETLNSNCDEGTLYANITDNCNVRFALKDAWGNNIRANSSINLSVLGQNTEGSYDVLAEKGTNFLNGIRLSDGVKTLLENGKTVHKVAWNTGADSQKQVAVSALLPSVTGVVSADSSAGIMGVASLPIPFEITAPTVSVRGELEATRSAISFSVNSKFNPWVSLRLSDNPNGAAPTSPWEIIPNASQCFYAYTTTGNTAKNLPTDYNVYVKGYTDDGVELQNENLKVEKEIQFRGVGAPTAEFGGAGNLCTTIHPKSGQVNLATAFTSKVQYNVEGKLVTLPGGVLGLMAGSECIFPQMCPTCKTGDPACQPMDPCAVMPALCVPPTVDPSTIPSCAANNSCECSATNTCEWEQPVFTPCVGKTSKECLCDVIAPGSCIEIMYLTAGADIEGGFLANSDKFLYTNSANNELNDQSAYLGENTVADIRETITRNIYTLIRGKTPEQNDGNLLDLTSRVSNLQDNGITYIKGGLVKIGTEGILSNVSGGKHTIIIENGNLLVDGDLKYATQNDSLGVVLINSTYTPKPATGNIFVNDKVSQFVGTYFSDGSMTTTQKHGNDANFNERITDWEVINHVLNRQLVLTGGLLTRNTLGGSELETPIDPWGNVVGTKLEAQKYDLHYIRRYNPHTDPRDILAQTPVCAKLDNATCYTNKHSFVIRVDKNTSYNTPPGFVENSKILP